MALYHSKTRRHTVFNNNTYGIGLECSVNTVQEYKKPLLFTKHFVVYTDMCQDRKWPNSPT